MARVEVAAASPPDPGFSLLDPPVMIWCQVLGLLTYLGVLVGLNLQLGILRALEYPLLGDASQLKVFLVRAGASSIGG